MKIKQLPKETYQKIAAGEIIDRPASVVRELIDNAIDAEASQIKVHLVEGGKKLIQVQDNGMGMSSNDLKICFFKHTTSKIKDFEDIYKTVSLGFRGEALNAISIVSELEILSKTQADTVGYSLIVKGGELLKEKETARNPGTSVLVRHLFYNIPVRQKALKSDNTELRYIKDVFIHKAIPFYDRDFYLTHNGKELYSSIKSLSALDRIMLFYGDDLKSHLVEVVQDFGDFHIRGYICEPNFFKRNKKSQFSYINQRPIFSPAISHAVSMAYEGITPVGHHPIAFLFLEIDPQLLDVNIHPTKREVKISIESAIHQAIYHLIKDMISRNHSLPKIELKDRVKNSLNTYYQNNNNAKQNDLLSHTNVWNHSRHFVKSPTAEVSNHDVLVEEGSEKEYRIMGVLFSTYILIEQGDEFLLLDQHAAHERLKYEQIKAKMTNDKIPSQPLLTPFNIDVPLSDMDLIVSKLDSLIPLGLDLEVFGEHSFIVRSIPYFLKLEQAQLVLDQLLEDIMDGKSLADPLSFIDNTLKMKACRSAVKSGDLLSHSELTHLVTELIKYPNPFACPHGRPTALHLSKTEIENLFLRT